MLSVLLFVVSSVAFAGEPVELVFSSTALPADNEWQAVVAE